MNTDTGVDFDVDTANHTLRIARVFAAPRQLVWNCYTTASLLDQWFAPRGLTVRTTALDFRDDGSWHYAMIDGDGGHHWVLMDYERIEPIDRFTLFANFSNEAGQRNANMPRAHWTVDFTEAGEHTRVVTHIRYACAADVDLVIRMGMREGFTSMLDRLVEQLLDRVNERTHP